LREVKPLSDTLSGGSYVRVNRLKDSFTWHVQVPAESSSLEHLQVAKEKAVQLSRELEADLNRKSEQVEVPF
jgi:hypothetical protein